jgi:sugar lactone lactonase YvrE
MQEVSDTDGKTYTVQYLERAVFELHPEFAGTENEVLLQLLGAFLHTRKYPQGASGQVASTDNPYKDTETGKSIGGRFRTYYENNGGLRQQGRPLSEEFTETSELDGKTYIVQYFERSVFELHPENQPPFDVLLSQLGTFRLKDRQSVVSQPTPAPTDVIPPPTTTIPSPTAQPVVQPPPVNAQFLGVVSDPNNPMVKPVGLAIDARDNLYVLSAGGSDPTAKVFEFSPEGQLIRKWPAPIEISSGFNAEIFGDLDIDSQGNVYVAQAGGITIEKYDNNGNHLQTIGSRGNGDGQFTRTISAAVDTQGNIYAVDDKRTTVQKFNSSGQFLLKTTQVHNNTGYATVDAQGNVYVAEYSTAQVEKFNSDLQIIAKWSGGLSLPFGIDVDKAGNVYVVNDQSATVVKFDPEGTPVGIWGTQGSGPGQFNDLYDVTVDSQGNIYIADGGNHNVQKFRLP